MALVQLLIGRMSKQFLCHHGRALRSQHHHVHHPDRRSIRHHNLGLGPRHLDLDRDRRLAGRNLRRLPDRRRRVLLERHAVDQGMGPDDVLH